MGLKFDLKEKLGSLSSASIIAYVGQLTIWISLWVKYFKKKRDEVRMIGAKRKLNLQRWMKFAKRLISK